MESSPVVTLFCSGFPAGVAPAMVLGKFESFGTVLGSSVTLGPSLGGGSEGEPAPRRRFVHVRLRAAEADVEACLKSLNGAAWAGGRLRVEQAREHYTDRMARERAERAALAAGGGDADYEGESEEPRRTRLRIRDGATGKLHIVDLSNPPCHKRRLTSAEPPPAKAARGRSRSERDTGPRGKGGLTESERSELSSRGFDTFDEPRTGGPPVRHKAPSAPGPAAGEDIDVKAENQQAMGLLDGMFGQSAASSSGSAADDAERLEREQRMTRLAWTDTQRYDPEAEAAVTLEVGDQTSAMEAAVGLGRAPLPEASGVIDPEASVEYNAFVQMFSQDAGSAAAAGAGGQMSFAFGGSAQEPAASRPAAIVPAAPAFVCTRVAAGAPDANDVCTFMRTEPVGELDKEWRNHREKLTLDYKRRRRDATRRKN